MSGYSQYGVSMSSNNTPVLYGAEAGAQSQRLHNGFTVANLSEQSGSESGAGSSSAGGAVQEGNTEAPPAYEAGFGANNAPRRDRKQVYRS